LSFRVPTRSSAAAALLLSAVAIAACGESAEDKAKAEVCGARSEISKQITKLQSLTISSNTVNEAKASFEVIGKELTKIKNAQPKLSPARKEQVQSGTQSFSTELSSIAAGVVSSLGSGSIETALKNAQPQVKAAVEKLAGSYQQALAPINC